MEKLITICRIAILTIRNFENSWVCAYDCACDWAYDASQNQAICSLISKYQPMSSFSSERNSQEVDNQKPEHVF